MIIPNMEYVLEVKAALAEAVSAAHKFCTRELARVSDAEYVAIVRDVRAGYDQRIPMISKRLDLSLDYLQDICEIFERAFGPGAEFRYEWLETLAKEEEPLGLGFRDYLRGTMIPEVDSLLQYVNDCAFPVDVISAHELVCKKMERLQFIINELVSMQERQREKTGNAAWNKRRAAQLLSKYKI